MMQWIAAFGPWIVGGAIAVGGVIWKLDRKQLTTFYDAHTTVKEREAIAADAQLVRTLAPEGVALAERECPQLSGPEKFAQAVAHVVGVLHNKGLVGDVQEIRGAVQHAYGIMKHDGTLAASTPAAPAPVPPAKA